MEQSDNLVVSIVSHVYLGPRSQPSSCLPSPMPFSHNVWSIFNKSTHQRIGVYSRGVQVEHHVQDKIIYFV